MKTIRIPVDKLRNGDMVAEEVFTEHTYVTLLVKGTIIDEMIKNRLIRLDIEDILISRSATEVDTLEEIAGNSHIMKKHEFKEEYKDNVRDVKDLFKNIFNGNNIDFEQVTSISDDIFKNLDEIYIAVESISEFKEFDEYTYIHSFNVALYSMLLAQWLELSKADIEDLVKAAFLHDIGKARIDDSILNKHDKFTYEEFAEMRNHPQYGYDICKGMNGVSDRVKEAVLSHHENIDGSGYPNGKKGDEISLFARIIAVCDVYDAITSKKVYKDKVTPFEAFDEIMQAGYGKLDTGIILTFLNNIRNLYVGLNVKMNTGEVGEVVFVPTDKISSPLIKIGEKFINLSENRYYSIEKIV